jgi:outer membrane usher protein
MRSRSTSSRTTLLSATAWLRLAAVALPLLSPAAALAFTIVDEPIPEEEPVLVASIAPDEPTAALPADPLADPAPEAAALDLAVETIAYDLYLDIRINGHPRNKIVAIHREIDGSLWVTPDDLVDIGLLPPAPAPAGERIALASLPGVTYVLDEEGQSIDFTAPETARGRLIVDADGEADIDPQAPEAAAPGVAQDFGVVLNYDLYASANMSSSDGLVVSPLSGNFEARAYGPFGLVEQTFSALADPFEVRRLNTTWSRSDPQAMRTYRAGDIVTGALGWTRPTRLGGVQVESDFGLRSDVVTYPVPSLSGSAALPSSVEVYVNNSSRYTGEVPEGPFEIVDVPVLTGAGTVELVVRDVNGRQIVTEVDYFTSPELLRPGLMDYSAEVGFARTHFGTDGDGYDRRLMGSASIRTGVTDWLTWEGHAEGGLELINAGTGAVVALGQLGVGQFSAAASRTADAMGAQLAGSLELGFGEMRVGARAQRSFGRYEDIASFTAPGITDRRSATPSTVYQLSLSLPGPFEGGRANLSYTYLDPAVGDTAQIVAASYGQRVFAGSGSASAYMDMESRNYGMTMSLWMPIGDDLSARTSVHKGDDRSFVTADIGRAAGNEIGDVGWLVRADRGDTTNVSASARARLPLATARARIAHAAGRTILSGELSGALAVADGGVFLANAVEDSFAIVDAGAPDVPVLSQNRLVGTTGGNGKLLVPGLTAYEKNRISIDPAKLPLDRVVENTSANVTPARGSGVVVAFGNRTEGGTALVTLRDEAGEFLPLASTGTAGADAPEFVVGYDGSALIEGLGDENIITVALPDGGACIADVSYAAQGGDLVDLGEIVCHAA